MNGHPTREEDFDLYALGALEGEEKQALESHLAGCAACTRKLAEARGRMSFLSAATEQIAPPASAKARLMKRIHEDAVSAKSLEPAAEPRSTFGRWWIAILAPAAVALAVATFILWRQNDELNRQLAGLRDNQQTIEKKIQAAQKELEFITSPDTMTIALKETPGMPPGTGKARYNPRMGMVEFDSAALPMPAADKSYQLWLVPKTGAPISAGVFRPDVTGKSTIPMASIQPGADPKVFAVTIEPFGGKPQPTGAMVLAGAPAP